MRRTDPQLKLRLPEKLKSEIEAWAKRNERSMNAEIVDRLELSVDETASIDALAALRFSAAFLVDAMLKELEETDRLIPDKYRRNQTKVLIEHAKRYADFVMPNHTGAKFIHSDESLRQFGLFLDDHIRNPSPASDPNNRKTPEQLTLLPRPGEPSHDDTDGAGNEKLY